MGGKDLLIPIGKVVLIHDHPEGHNKIQDNNKDQIYVITEHHNHKNAYFVKPLCHPCLFIKYTLICWLGLAYGMY